MITVAIFSIWFVSIFIPLFQSLNDEDIKPSWWIIWAITSLVWIIPIFTGLKVHNNSGQYVGYVTAVEQNGAIFKGWNVFLKTDLQSSNEDMACINRDDQELINRLKQAQENKENLVLEYEGVWQYAIGECPQSNWMIINIK